jgi:hypothetical protein
MATRLTDVGDEVDLENDCPLVGLHKAEALSFHEAVQRCAGTLGLDDPDELAAFLRCAVRKAERLLSTGEREILSSDEIAAVNLYTQETPLYRKLNALLRKRSRKKLLPAFSYLRLLLTALHKLGCTRDTVFRGVTEDLASRYPKGLKLVWWGFSSCTASLETLQDEEFLGSQGKRSLFSVKADVVDIQRYSAMGFE